MTATLLAAITPDTELLIPVGVLCAFISGLIVSTWRLANFVRGLRDEVNQTWSFRDQERWALQLERENRERNIPIFVPDVKRAPPQHKTE
ncbi:hypothetical protein Ga0100231_004970 [Opitutaceae bacterium TAV4]|nr:hypothetical protein Ga0100231_004970 [Opitutaceae bacterium TAV4]RRK02347.1 hypothetical protein Ga0100230_004115 [Opitutaceae bacterium TAV3]